MYLSVRLSFCHFLSFPLSLLTNSRSRYLRVGTLPPPALAPVPCPPGFGFFILLNEVGFVLATLFFTVREFWHCYKSGPRLYFIGYWNLAETAIILTSYAAIALYVYRYRRVSS